MHFVLRFAWVVAVAFAVLPLPAVAETKAQTEQHKFAEITFHSTTHYDDPFNTLQLDLAVIAPDGQKLLVPAFWDGGEVWKARYACGKLGKHTYITVCSDTANAGLHGVAGEIEVVKGTSTNPLYRNGPIRVAGDKRHFEHEDGTPFFWLGDTWWMGLCQRLKFPEEFATLTADRVKKGFNVVQIVAGLYPDMPAFDERGANEAGFPWDKDYKSIRPEYFDAADKRLMYLCDAGLSPCIVGAWGYFAPWMGEEKLKKHWRYLVARYGALPVTWCIAGEANLPWYLVKNFPYDDREQVKTWTAVARYVRSIDPCHRPLTIHPTGLGKLSSRGAIDDPTLLDFDMLQTGHGGLEVMNPTMKTFNWSYNEQPTMPIVNGEVSYEMLMDKFPPDTQRACFWAEMLSGAAGHTYGANGIWQCNRKGQPHGKSPHGGTYGAIAWDDAMNLPGSTQLGLAKKFFVLGNEKLKWRDKEWRNLKPILDWASFKDQAQDAKAEERPYTAAISSDVLIYAPLAKSIVLRKLAAGNLYIARVWNPLNGEYIDKLNVYPEGSSVLLNNNITSLVPWSDEVHDLEFAPPKEIKSDWILVITLANPRGV